MTLSIGRLPYFFAALIGLCACDQLPAAAEPTPPVARSNSGTATLLRSEQYAELERRFSALQSQFEGGSMSGDDLRAAFREFYATDSDLAPKLDGWVARYNSSYVARVARGIYYKRVGLESRGTAYINATSQSQINGMNAAFQKAVADFRASENLSPKPFLTYFHLLDIGNAVGAKENLRAIYDLANRLDPSSYAVKLKYMNTLHTRWGGSLEEMQSFYAECQRSGLTDAQSSELKAMLEEEKLWLARRT